jgi:hypothetical protein
MFLESYLFVTRTIGKLEIAIGEFGKNTVCTHVTMKDQIYKR